MQEEPKGNREVRYRIRAKEAEAKATALSQALRATRESLLTQLASGKGKLDPSAAPDVFRNVSDDELNGLFDDDGHLDQKALDAFVNQQRTAHPYLADRHPTVTIPGDDKHPTRQPWELRKNWSNAFA